MTRRSHKDRDITELLRQHDSEAVKWTIDFDDNKVTIWVDVRMLDRVTPVLMSKPQHQRQDEPQIAFISNDESNAFEEIVDIAEKGTEYKHLLQSSSSSSSSSSSAFSPLSSSSLSFSSVDPIQTSNYANVNIYGDSIPITVFEVKSKSWSWDLSLPIYFESSPSLYNLRDFFPEYFNNQLSREQVSQIFDDMRTMKAQVSLTQEELAVLTRRKRLSILTEVSIGIYTF